MAPRENISGPHVSAAFLCEKVLTERDGVSTFVRVVERFTMQKVQIGVPPADAPAQPFPPAVVQATLVVMLKSGDLGAGKFKVTIVFAKDGNEINRQDLDVFFGGGDENGVAIVSPVILQEPEEGLHWFDVLFEDHPLTRIPMRIIYPQQTQFMPGLSPRVP
jgi:hypothetical protein